MFNNKRVETHIVRRGDTRFKMIDELCFGSKNLWNTAVWTIRRHLEETGKWLRYGDVDKKIRKEYPDVYYALPPVTSQQVLILVDKAFKGYFSLMKIWKKSPDRLSGCPRPPKYKDKIKGRNLLVFVNYQARHKPDMGLIRFPKSTGLPPMNTKISGKLCQVKIIPTSGCYKIDVVYDAPQKSKVLPNEYYLSIDLGLNNLITAYDSINNKGFIFSGGSIKSINQFYNKKRASIQSELKNRHNLSISRRLLALTFKRNNKIKDYLHKTSRFIVNYLQENGISNLVVGYNEGWKTKINLGRQTNQNFVQIPFRLLIDQMKYKCEEVGISFQTIQEAYTSKCSALDLEPIKKQENYQGRRIKRGLFVASNKTSINADLNGAINILRKATGDKVFGCTQAQSLTSRGQVSWPVKFTPS